MCVEHGRICLRSFDYCSAQYQSSIQFFTTTKSWSDVPERSRALCSSCREAPQSANYFLLHWYIGETSVEEQFSIYSRHTNIYRVPEPPQKNDTDRDRWNTRKFQVVRLNFLLFFVERLDFNDYGWICMINRVCVAG